MDGKNQVRKEFYRIAYIELHKRNTANTNITISFVDVSLQQFSPNEA